MTLEQIIFIAIVGLIGGIVSGLTGVGGGLIIVPLLVFILGFSQHKAQGTFIIMATFPVQILSAIEYYKKGNVDWKVALILLIVFTLGSYIGGYFANNFVETKLLKKFFAIFLFVVAFRMFFFD